MAKIWVPTEGVVLVLPFGGFYAMEIQSLAKKPFLVLGGRFARVRPAPARTYCNTLGCLHIDIHSSPQNIIELNHTPNAHTCTTAVRSFPRSHP